MFFLGFGYKITEKFEIPSDKVVPPILDLYKFRLKFADFVNSTTTRCKGDTRDVGKV